MSESPAVLRHGEREYELPVVVGTEGETGIDISKLRGQSGMVTLDNALVNTASCESAITFIDGEAGILRYRGIDIEDLVNVANPSYLETAYLLIYGELPTQAERDQFSPRDPQAHARARRREAVLRRLPEGRAPDGNAVVGGHRAEHLLPRQPRPEGPGAGRAVDRAAHGQAAHHRGLRVQEVDRPTVRLSEQRARPHRELPHHDVLRAFRALRGQPGRGERAQEAADPPRRPRAELLHLHRAPRRLE